MHAYLLSFICLCLQLRRGSNDLWGPPRARRIVFVLLKMVPARRCVFFFQAQQQCFAKLQSEMNQLARPLARTRPAVLPRQADKTPPGPHCYFTTVPVHPCLTPPKNLHEMRAKGTPPASLVFGSATGAESKPNGPQVPPCQKSGADDGRKAAVKDKGIFHIGQLAEPRVLFGWFWKYFKAIIANRKSWC